MKTKLFFLPIVLIHLLQPLLYGQTTPTITLQLVSQTVNEGQTVIFRVGATCSGQLGFQWWGSGSNQWNSGDKNGRLTIVNTSNSSTLTITNVNVAQDNNNEFTCEVKNLDNYPNPGSWINTNTVYLTVNSATDWRWAKSGNGTSAEFGHSIAVDRWGNSYLLGTYNSPSINFSGTILNNSSSNDDIFLVKYDAEGYVTWAKTFGSTGKEYATEVDVDSLGNIFIGGGFESSSINFDAYTLFNSTSNSKADLFLVKLSATGIILWAKSAGGNSIDIINSIAVDSLGNSFITGSYASSSITFGSTILTSSGDDEVFTAKYDYDGNPLWAKHGNGSGSYDWGSGVAVDGADNCYVIGSFTSQSITFGSYILTNSNINGSSDIFVVKYDSSGNIVWAKKWGSSGEDLGQKIDVSRDGKCYLTGPYSSSLITFGTNTLTNVNAGLSDLYLTKLDVNGNAIWALSGNGNHGESPYDIALDQYENVVVAGSFASDILFFGTASLTNASIGNIYDIFLVKFDSQGNLIWTSRAGGTASELCENISVYNSESFFIAGSYTTNNLTFGSTILSLTGGRDVFTAYSGNNIKQGILSVTPPFHGVPASSGTVTFDVNNLGGGIMNWNAVSNDPSWLAITSGSSGTNAGQITVSYQSNTADYRVGTITITSPTTINSPDTIEVRQTAYGTDWIVKTSSTKENLTDVKFINGQIGWVCGGNGLLLKTTDGGLTWNKQTTNTTLDLYKIFFFPNYKGLIVGANGIILGTVDNGTTWELKNSDTTIQCSKFQFLDENLGWAWTNKLILKTTNGGISWFIIKTGDLGREKFNSLNFRDANNGILVGYCLDGGFPQLKTTDGGITWIEDYFPTEHEARSFKFDDDNLHGLLFEWIEDHGEFLHFTTNGGITWVGSNILMNGYTGLSNIDSHGDIWLGYQTYATNSSDCGFSWGCQFIGSNAVNIRSISGFDSTLAWAIGNNGNILRYQRTQNSKYLKFLKLIPTNQGGLRAGGTAKIIWECNGIDQIQINSYQYTGTGYAGPRPEADNVSADQGSFLWRLHYLWRYGGRIELKSYSNDNLIDWSDCNIYIAPNCFNWSFTSNTGKSASISIPSSINPIFSDYPMEVGDVIGIFYHRNDSLICGGYSYWTEEDTVTITAWGDNDTTVIKDGFYEGEKMILKIFNPNSCEEYFTKVSFLIGSSNYSTNSNCVLGSLMGINGVKVVVEGLYQLDDDSWQYYKLYRVDTISAYLRNSYAPYEVVDSAKSLLDSLGFVANFNFTHASNGTYYLVIKHRNSLETWSSMPVTLTESNINCYNFTDDSSKAYGNNMKKVGNEWCVYSGDVNQDNFIDGADVSPCFNASNFGVSGYVATDLTGDGFVDGTDVSIAFNNNNLGVGAQYPSEKFLFTKPENLTEPGIK